MKLTASQIASYLSGKIEGDPEVVIRTLSKIEEGKPGCLTFLANPKYTQFIYTTKASAVLVNKDFVAEQPISATLIRVENSYECLARLLNLVAETKKARTGIETPCHIDESASVGENIYIGSFSYIGEDSQIGNNTKIYPNVYVGSDVTIGDDCVIYPGVKIYDDCMIGNRCILQAGAVIGGDGFGFAPQKNGEFEKIAQIGNVIIEDDVEIGANTTVDRATMGSTIIRKGVKLDNLIQVAHNVEIGENTVMAAQAGIAGSTKVGSNCMIGGQVGFAGHLHIADKVQIGAQSGIANNISDNSSPYLGTPALPVRDFARSFAIFKKLPEIDAKLDKMIKKSNSASK